MSVKWIEDAIADLLIPGLAPGRADADPRLNFEYSQRKTIKNEPSGVEVTIEEV